MVGHKVSHLKCACVECSAPRRGRVGVASQQQSCREFLWIGGGGSVSSGQCNFRIGCVGEGFNTGMSLPVCRLARRKQNRGTMAAVPLALASVPCNSVFPCMSLVLPELLALCPCPGWMSVNESMCRPFKGRVWVFSFFSFHLDSQNPY